MTERRSTLHRKTSETDISCTLNLDGSGIYDIDTGVGFLDHMLTHVSKHGRIDLSVKATGDLHIDSHHTVEDVGLCLGSCLLEALGDKKGIARYGSSSVPMEDALANIALDLSGRPYFVYKVEYPTEHIGNFEVECLEEFLRSLVNTGKLNLHVNSPYGTNSHHIAEAIFKGLGQALSQAIQIVGGDIPSTKGVL
ncbi:MAG: imidazoleglycerol-phosphate dehydratase HisB [Planctomycetes bacterium]|nr:imidazoleglycerol-phosphate dehydratase HisB [Planctomycetota bacterium]